LADDEISDGSCFVDLEAVEIFKIKKQKQPCRQVLLACASKSMIDVRVCCCLKSQLAAMLGLGEICRYLVNEDDTESIFLAAWLADLLVDRDNGEPRAGFFESVHGGQDVQVPEDVDRALLD
jgi:hypothetical protein